MKKFLGIDLSTSTVGFSIVDEEGNLLEISHVSPESPKGVPEMEKLRLKAIGVVNFMLSKGWHNYDIEKIVIEEPMSSSSAVVSVALLNKFHGCFYTALCTKFPDGIEIHYISERDARLAAMPELHREEKGKRVIWGSCPREIGCKKIKDYRKLLVMLQMAKRFPNAEWSLNSLKNLNKKNFDRADSLCTVLGFMINNGYVQNLAEKFDCESSYEFVEKYFEYLDWCKELKGNAQDKKSKKILYLEDNLKIKSYFNIDIYE